MILICPYAKRVESESQSLLRHIRIPASVYPIRIRINAAIGGVTSSQRTSQLVVEAEEQVVSRTHAGASVTDSP